MLGLSTVEQLISLIKIVGYTAALAAELVELVPVKAIRGSWFLASSSLYLRALGLYFKNVGISHWEFASDYLPDDLQETKTGYKSPVCQQTEFENKMGF